MEFQPPGRRNRRNRRNVYTRKVISQTLRIAQVALRRGRPREESDLSKAGENGLKRSYAAQPATSAGGGRALAAAGLTANAQPLRGRERSRESPSSWRDSRERSDAEPTVPLGKRS